MSILVVISNRCSHCNKLMEFINAHSQLKAATAIHVIEVNGLPNNYDTKIERVPTILTRNGKQFVGQECYQWLQSLLPVDELTSYSIYSSTTHSALSGPDEIGSMFSLDSYGQSLQPPMTKELQDKISRKVE